MKRLVGYNIFLDDKLLIPNHLPATLKVSDTKASH